MEYFQKLYGVITGKINSDAVILCDDGEKVYKKNYSELIDELRAEFDQTENVICNDDKKYIKTKIKVNGLDCSISFNGSHYCGYVIDDLVKNMNISENDIDYEAHGGYTAWWGFDCGHFTDICFMSNMSWSKKEIQFPYEPPKGFGNENNKKKPTFKTRKFVIKELEKITDAILKYKSEHPQGNKDNNTNK